VLNYHWLKERIEAAKGQHPASPDEQLQAVLRAAYEKYLEIRPNDGRCSLFILEEILWFMVRLDLVERKWLKRPGEITFPVFQQVAPMARGEQG